MGKAVVPRRNFMPPKRVEKARILAKPVTPPPPATPATVRAVPGAAVPGASGPKGPAKR